jgi:hypothetical protein
MKLAILIFGVIMWLAGAVSIDDDGPHWTWKSAVRMGWVVAGPMLALAAALWL